MRFKRASPKQRLSDMAFNKDKSEKNLAITQYKTAKILLVVAILDILKSLFEIIDKAFFK